MKQKKEYLLIILLSLIPFLPILVSSNLPHTHDGLVHLPRMAAFYKALSDGQFPVRWAGDLNYGYGMPLFNFVYHLPYYVSSMFLWFGTGLVLAFKLTLIVSFLLSGVFMLLFAKSFFQDQRKAFLVTIFYQFASFRFVELLIRGSFGEVYTYTFLPLILYALFLLFKRFTVFAFVLAALSTALLIISHNSVSLLFFGVVVLFVCFFAKSKRNFMSGFSALAAGLMLAAYYWIPAIADHKYTYGNLFMKDIYAAHFVPLYQFFIPNIMNSKILQTEGIATQFGVFHTIAFFFALFLLYKGDKKTDKRVIWFALLLTIGSLFFMQPVSTIIWKNISLLRQFQFPWRFLSIIVFSTSLLAGGLLTMKFFKKNSLYWILLGSVMLSTAYFWFPNLGYDTVDEMYYWNFPLNTTYYGETDVIWSAGPAKAYPKRRIEVIGGAAKLSAFDKRSDEHTFIVEASTDSTLVSHTQYFPGWKVYVDGNEVKNIQFQDPNHRGEIVFGVPKGKHTVAIRFEETKIRQFADIVSVLTAIGLLGSLNLNRLAIHKKK